MKTATAIPQLNASPEKDELKRALGYSVILHVALFVIFTVRAFLNPSAPLQLENAIRVDMVAMPDKVAHLPPAPVEAPAPKPEEKKPEPPKPKAETKPEPEKPTLPKAKPLAPKPENPKINLNKTKRDQEAALKRLAALEKLKNSAPAPEVPKTAAIARPAPVKGNQISHGASLKGIAKLDYQNYNDTIHEHIHRFWNLPQWMANAKLSAVILVFIDADGRLIKKSVARSSGRNEFDERALQAIEAASPLPRPPSELVDILSVEGMQIEMSPD